MSKDVIFTPLTFRNLTVKNRIFRSSISGRFDNEDGSLTQTRINWACKFAKGGVGAIISSYVPVLMEGRIIAGYAFHFMKKNFVLLNLDYVMHEDGITPDEWQAGLMLQVYYR